LSEAPAPARKLPVIEPDTAFFWQSGEHGVLSIQRCDDCGYWQHPPFPRCAKCHGEALGPQAVSGKGHVATYTVNHEAWLPGLEVPFVFAAVELAEQPELYVFSNIQEPADSVTHGIPVRVTFEQHDDVWLPMFVTDHGAGD
jgi:uncharacterized protein